MESVAEIFDATKPLFPTPQRMTFDWHLLSKSIASLKDLPSEFLTLFNALIWRSITFLAILL